MICFSKHLLYEFICYLISNAYFLYFIIFVINCIELILNNKVINQSVLY